MNNITVVDLTGKRKTLKAETPDPNAEGTPCLGYSPTQRGYHDNLVRTGSFSNKIPMFRREGQRFSVRELRAQRTKKLNLTVDQLSETKKLEPIHESLEENEDRQAFKPADASNLTTPSFSSRGKRLQLATDKVGANGAQRRDSSMHNKVSPTTPSRSTRLAKLADATNNAKQGGTAASPTKVRNQSPPRNRAGASPRKGAGQSPQGSISRQANDKNKPQRQGQ